MAPSAPVAVIDALNSLLEAELSSIFRFMGEGSPYLSRASAEVKRPLNEMVQTNARHVADLSGLIESLGGFPVPRSIRPEEQYLSFLSLKFLLPKLVDAKRLTIERYENTLKAVEKAPNAPPEVIDVLNRHLAEHRAQLGVLEKAAAAVLAGK
jgi:hypothetical protein